MNTATAVSTTNYASFGQRLLAWLIDVILLGVVQFFVIVPILTAVGLGMASEMSNMQDTDDPAAAMGMMGAFAGAMATVYLISFAVQILYFSLMESSNAQASVGKLALGIKVTDTNGAKLTFVKALVRSVGKIISGMVLFIGYIIAAFTEKKQALHDMIASTLVVKK